MVKVSAKIVTKADISVRRGELTIHSRDDKGRPSEFSIGFSEFLRLAAEVKAATMQSTVSAPGLGFRLLDFVEPTAVELALTEERTPNIALVFDRGSTRQIAYRLLPETAESLREKLGEFLAQARQSGARTNPRDQ